MRIIGGEWRSRRLVAPTDRRVRPTSDKVREAWMSILRHDIPGARVVDLCAGSGALGLEALSRGAVHAEFVELAAPSLAAAKRNIEALGAGPRSTVRRGEAVRVAREAPVGAWDIAFADPPYDLGTAAALAELWLGHRFARILGVEHRAGAPMPAGGDTRRYGDTAITFYRDDTPDP